MMNYTKIVKRFLITSIILSSLSINGMEIDNGAGQEKRSHGMAFGHQASEAGKRQKLTALPQNLASQELYFPDETWDNTLRFSDTQSFGRLRQVSMRINKIAHIYLESLEGKKLIETLKKMEFHEQLDLLSRCTSHCLHASDRFLDAFYCYFELPSENRLFAHNYDELSIQNITTADDFSHKMNDYVPYGLCLMASCLLNPHEESFQEQIDAKMRDLPPVLWMTESSDQSYLIFIPYKNVTCQFSEKALGAVTAINNLFSNP